MLLAYHPDRPLDAGGCNQDPVGATLSSYWLGAEREMHWAKIRERREAPSAGGKRGPGGWVQEPGATAAKSDRL